MSAISFASSAGLFLGGMRISRSLCVMRLTTSLAALLPGVTTFDLSRSSRVSKETLPLYLPFVWHSAHRVFRIGAMSWAKSIFLGSPARADDVIIRKAPTIDFTFMMYLKPQDERSDSWG